MVKELPPFHSFEGQLIISTQTEGSRFFDKSLVLITSHTSEKGAQGYVMNQPLPSLSPVDIFQERDLSNIPKDLVVMCGGPVDLKHAVILHTDEYKALDTRPLPNGLAVTETQQILDDIVQGIGPKKFLVLVGTSIWEAGQLEEEFMANMWIDAPFSFDLLFNTPDNKKWQEALATLNINANLLTNIAGKA